MNLWTTLLFIIALNAFNTEESRLLSVKVVDEKGDTLPCRAWVESGGARLFRPASPAESTPYERDQSFSCPGYFSIRVPGKEASIHVEKGKEYQPVERQITLSGKEHSVTIELRRWINMPEEGWYSADMHVHLGADRPDILKQLALADDVHLTPVFTYWLRGTEPSWPDQWPAAGEGREEVIDSTHVVTRQNIEIERIHRASPPGASIGASFLFNLDQPVFSGRYGRHFPTDATLCLAAREHSPEVVIDTDKASWAETVVGAALGAFDTVQVCHNHFHREQTLSGGWGMVAPLLAGESNASGGDGLFHRTNSLYYRFLNCGFRLGVSGGSAIGVMPVPMGYSRVYARVEEPFSSEKFWAAVKTGQTFATSGPILDMTVDGYPIGATVKPASAIVEVKARVRSIDRLETVQLIHDGKVAGDNDLISLPVEPSIDHLVSWQITPKRSGWVAARVLFRGPQGHLRQAHTSPVYLMIDEMPIANKEDATYMIRWINELVKIAHQDGRFPKKSDRDSVLRIYAKAKSVYEKVLVKADGL